jgi:hypothetical protein
MDIFRHMKKCCCVYSQDKIRSVFNGTACLAYFELELIGGSPAKMNKVGIFSETNYNKRLVDTMRSGS